MSSDVSSMKDLLSDSSSDVVALARDVSASVTDRLSSDNSVSQSHSLVQSVAMTSSHVNTTGTNMGTRIDTDTQLMPSTTLDVITTGSSLIPYYAHDVDTQSQRLGVSMEMMIKPTWTTLMPTPTPTLTLKMNVLTSTKTLMSELEVDHINTTPRVLVESLSSSSTIAAMDGYETSSSLSMNTKLSELVQRSPSVDAITSTDVVTSEHSDVGMAAISTQSRPSVSSSVYDAGGAASLLTMSTKLSELVQRMTSIDTVRTTATDAITISTDATTTRSIDATTTTSIDAITTTAIDAITTTSIDTVTAPPIDAITTTNLLPSEHSYVAVTAIPMQSLLSVSSSGYDADGVAISPTMSMKLSDVVRSTASVVSDVSGVSHMEMTVSMESGDTHTASSGHGVLLRGYSSAVQGGSVTPTVIVSSSVVSTVAATPVRVNVSNELTKLARVSAVV